MKNQIIVFLSLILWSQIVLGQITVTGALSGNGTYSSLTKSPGSAFQAINSGAQNNAEIVITINKDITVETGAVSLNQASWKSLTIKPSGVRTVSGSADGPLINLNGADRVTIDGLNTATDSLVISNTKTSTSAAISTIRFAADATNNIITNCTVLGAGRSTTNNSGTIFFSTGTAKGNDSITISNCKIGPALPNKHARAIFAQGSEANPNNYITITNCEIFDYTPTTSAGGFGIFAVSGNSDFVISNNKFYHTSKLINSGAQLLADVNVANDLFENIEITGNTFGYSSPHDTGTLEIQGGYYRPIYVYGKALATKPYIISFNVISNIALTGGSFSTDFDAINFGYPSLADTFAMTVQINNNIIRNITFAHGGEFNAIYTYMGNNYSPKGTMVLDISNNKIDNLKRTKQGAFYGIGVGYGTNVSVLHNTINNIQTLEPSASSEICAINLNGQPANLKIDNNTISNLSSNSTGSIGIEGINSGTWYNPGSKSIQNNTIFNLSTSGYGNVYGIYEALTGTATSVNLSGNYIHSFSAGRTIKGIYHGSSCDNINIKNNKVSGLTVTDPSVYSKIIGIEISGNGLQTNVFNNVIGDLNATATSNKNAVIGLHVTGKLFKVYHNSVYLNASSSSTTTFGTICLNVAGASSLDLQNNNLVNLSTPAQENLNIATNGISACLKMNITVSGSEFKYQATSDNNNFWCNPASGTNNHLVFYDEFASSINNPKNTLADFKAFLVDRDLHSVQENPVFASLTGTDDAFLDVSTSSPTLLESGAIKINGISNDFAGTVRFGSPGYFGKGTAPDIGAFEFEGVKFVTEIKNLDDIGSFRIWSSNNLINIEIPELQGANVMVNFYDVLGRSLFQKTVQLQPNTSILVPSYKGIVFVKIQSKNELYSEKLIIQ